MIWDRMNANDVVYEYMTAGGLNTPEQVDEILEDAPSTTDLANEIFENWDIVGVTFDDMTDAVADFITSRPDRRN